LKQRRKWFCSWVLADHNKAADSWQIFTMLPASMVDVISLPLDKSCFAKCMWMVTQLGKQKPKP